MYPTRLRTSLPDHKRSRQCLRGDHLVSETLDHCRSSKPAVVVFLNLRIVGGPLRRSQTPNLVSEIRDDAVLHIAFRRVYEFPSPLARAGKAGGGFQSAADSECSRRVGGGQSRSRSPSARSLVKRGKVPPCHPVFPTFTAPSARTSDIGT